MTSGAMLNVRTLMSEGEGVDDDLFLAAIEPLLPAAYRLGFALLRNRSEVDDVIQDSVLNAWKHKLTLKPGSDLRPWFMAIVANQCRQAVRGRWWSVVRLPGLVWRDQQEAEDDVDDVAALRTALRRLRHADRLVLVLRYYMDMSYDQIGLVMDVSPQAARVRTHRALGRLRPILDSGDDTSG
jgi:RNA polymerase sigma factor (sigma-70 family)